MIFDVANLEAYSLSIICNPKMAQVPLVKKATWKNSRVVTINIGDLRKSNLLSPIDYHNLSSTLVGVPDSAHLAVKLHKLVNNSLYKDESSKVRAVYGIQVSIPQLPSFGAIVFANYTYNSALIKRGSSQEELKFHCFDNTVFKESFSAKELIKGEAADEKWVTECTNSVIRNYDYYFDWSDQGHPTDEIVDFVHYLDEVSPGAYLKWGWDKFSHEYKKFYYDKGKRLGDLVNKIDYAVAASEDTYNLIHLKSWKAFQHETYLQSNCIGKSKNYYNRSLQGANYYFSLRQTSSATSVLATVAVKVESKGVKYEVKITQEKGYSNKEVAEDTSSIIKRLVMEWATSKYGKGNAYLVPKKTGLYGWQSAWLQFFETRQREVAAEFDIDAAFVNYDGRNLNQEVQERGLNLTVDSLARLTQDPHDRFIRTNLEEMARALGVSREFLDPTQVRPHVFEVGQRAGKTTMTVNMVRRLRESFSGDSPLTGFVGDFTAWDYASTRQSHSRTHRPTRSPLVKTLMFSSLYGGLADEAHYPKYMLLSSPYSKEISYASTQKKEDVAKDPSEFFVKYALSNSLFEKSNVETSVRSHTAVDSVLNFKVDLTLTLPDRFKPVEIPAVVTSEFTKFSDPHAKKRHK